MAQETISEGLTVASGGLTLASEPGFPHLPNRHNNSPHLMGKLSGFNDNIWVKCAEGCRAQSRGQTCCFDQDTKAPRAQCLTALPPPTPASSRRASIPGLGSYRGGCWAGPIGGCWE